MSRAVSGTGNNVNNSGQFDIARMTTGSDDSSEDTKADDDTGNSFLGDLPDFPRPPGISDEMRDDMADQLKAQLEYDPYSRESMFGGPGGNGMYDPAIAYDPNSGLNVALLLAELGFIGATMENFRCGEITRFERWAPSWR